LPDASAGCAHWHSSCATEMRESDAFARFMRIE
jgi:hypothetical protein